MKQVDNQESKNEIFTKVAAVASTLGSSARLKILYVLAQAPRSVEVIAQITGESVAHTSQHLQKLLREGLAVMKKDKLSRVYNISDDLIALLIENLFDLSEKISPTLIKLENSLTGPESDNPVTLISILEDIQNKKSIMLDVREECEASYSPVIGALALSIKNLKEKAKTLKKNKTYYLFCRGRACELAIEGVSILRTLGFKAFRLKESPSSIRNTFKLTTNNKKE